MHDDLGADFVFLVRLDHIAVRTLGNPGITFSGLAFGVHLDFVAHHKGRVETYTELTDNIDVVLFLQGFFEV